MHHVLDTKFQMEKQIYANRESLLPYRELDLPSTQSCAHAFLTESCRMLTSGFSSYYALFLYDKHDTLKRLLAQRNLMTEHLTHIFFVSYLFTCNLNLHLGNATKIISLPEE